ncbi:MAG: hypothetical protein EBZ77_13345, partial [Chitinophagia bacterium]|nr:hypothetical protein [Chitinophagia bacterium]
VNKFQPDRYYKVTIVAQDNVWRSEPITFYVYTVPLWYQTSEFVRALWVGIILLLLVALTTAILVTLKMVITANRKRNLRMELELKSIYAQINPHFIFNTLNSALLLVSKNKMEEAYDHIFKFSRLLRNYIRSSRNRYISLHDEISNLVSYIELQQVRFKNRFDLVINVAPDTDTTNIELPSLLLQPFVENAINHGLLPKGEKGKLLLSFVENKAEKTLLCSIEDDGIGRKQSKLYRESSGNNNEESYGNLLIKDLVNIFNSYENIKIDIQYTDLPLPKTGTIVNISIKYA